MRPSLAAALVLALAGCQMATIMGESSSPWFEAGPSRLPPSELVAITREMMLRQGYRLLPAATDATRLGSEWEVHLSPHWREGYRFRVDADIRPAENGAGHVVRVRSQREVNNDAGKPTMAEHAQWMSASLDEKQKTRIDEPALKLHQLLKFKLETR